MAKSSLNIYSINANGLKERRKRNIVFQDLKRLKNSIYLLQETHCTNEMENVWNLEWGNKLGIYSHGSSKSRGVAILFSNDLEIEVIKNVKDDNGRYMIAEVEIEGKDKLTLVSLYAPTCNFQREQIDTVNSLRKDLAKFSKNCLIIGGDFNIKLDKANPTNNVNYNQNLYEKELLLLLEQEKLVDICKVKNTNSNIYTWSRGNQRSRLDYFFISDYLQNSNCITEILPPIMSDHNVVRLMINIDNTQDKGKGFWKCNNSHLKDIEYIHEIKNSIKECVNKFAHLKDHRVLWELIKLKIKLTSIKYSIKKKKKQITY
jgi:exodeoxyribonuclease-3